MKKTELKKIEKHYLDLKEKILKSINNSDNETDSDGDEVDEVQAKAIAEIADKLSKRQINSLNKINIALKKINDGDFGNCEECGNVIGIKRLEALPGVQFCIECAENQES